MSGRRLSTRWRVSIALLVCAALATGTTAALAVGVLLALLGGTGSAAVHLSTQSLRGVIGAVAVAGGLAVWPALGAGLLLARPLWMASEQLARGAQALAAREDGAGAAVLPAGAPVELAGAAGALRAIAAGLRDEEEGRRRFVADAAHELRTPVTGLRAYLEAMRDGVLPCDGERVELALGELARMDRLIADLGKLSALETATAPPAPLGYDLGPQLREVLALFRPAMSARSLRLDVDIPERTLSVRARPDDVAEVLHNLLRNATDYGRAGGAVRLRVDRTPGWVRLRLYNDVRAPVERPERLFDRFYRSDPSRARATGGSGLGLPIVRRLVLGMGGTVALRPAGRSGIEAVVRLPAAR